MALDPKIRINLDRSVVLLVDDNPQALEALASMFRGFGVRKQFKATSGAEAMHFVKGGDVDEDGMGREVSLTQEDLEHVAVLYGTVKALGGSSPDADEAMAQEFDSTVQVRTARVRGGA